MNIEAWVGLSGVALVVAGGWGGIYWKLATIAAKVEVLLESSSLDREERRRGVGEVGRSRRTAGEDRDQSGNENAGLNKEKEKVQWRLTWNCVGYSARAVYTTA